MRRNLPLCAGLYAYFSQASHLIILFKNVRKERCDILLIHKGGEFQQETDKL